MHQCILTSILFAFSLSDGVTARLRLLLIASFFSLLNINDELYTWPWRWRTPVHTFMASCKWLDQVYSVNEYGKERGDRGQVSPKLIKRAVYSKENQLRNIVISETSKLSLEITDVMLHEVTAKKYSGIYVYSPLHHALCSAHYVFTFWGWRT